MKTIQYAIDRNTGLVFSKYLEHGSIIGVAIPVLDFEHMKPENNFETIYNLEVFTIYEAYQGTDLVWTRKIPNSIKNLHREFWGMKPLRGKNRWEK